MKAILNCDKPTGRGVMTDVPCKKSKSGYKVEILPGYHARKGDEVLIISDHGNVTIVENNKGYRFTVMTENLENILE